jgi:hypothetical protein
LVDMDRQKRPVRIIKLCTGPLRHGRLAPTMPTFISSPQSKSPLACSKAVEYLLVESQDGDNTHTRRGRGSEASCHWAKNHDPFGQSAVQLANEGEGHDETTVGSKDARGTDGPSHRKAMTYI